MTDATVIDPSGAWAIDIREVLSELGRQVGEVNVANGWDTSRSMIAEPGRFNELHQAAHKIAELGLIDTEASEAIEQVRAGRAMTETYYSWHPKKLGTTGWQVGMQMVAWCETCGWGISINQVEPSISNGTRTPQQVADAHLEYRDPGDTHVVRWASKNKPEGVPSELADVVIRALDIADAYGIDLGAALIEKLNHNATRGLHHGGKAL
jgi:hypothetical protein